MGQLRSLWSMMLSHRYVVAPVELLQVQAALTLTLFPEAFGP